jgi:hypothetical protein
VRILRFLSAVLIVLMMAACATLPSLNQQAAAFPALETGQARVYFYRTSAAGGASEPAVLLNGQQVGDATPRSVFLRDVAPGKYSVTTTMTSRIVTFDVAAGDKKYVRLVYGSSFNTYPELVDSATGEAESSQLSYVRQRSAAMIAGAPPRAEEATRAVFSGGGEKVVFWQTNRLSDGQGTCAVKFGFNGTDLNQPIDNLTLAIRTVGKNGADLGVANLALVDPLGGSGVARYREALFEGGASSPLCDEGTSLIVESAIGKQSGKVIELVRFGQLEFTSFPRINVRVGK